MVAAPTILVVEDEPGVLQPLRDILQRAGYVVTAVDSGEAALDEIARQEFDLALIDIKLKGISGMEVLAVLRERSPDTVAIILTAHATLETAVEALRQGAHDYLFKPCRTEELLESVRSGLLKRRSQSPAQVSAGSPLPPATPARRVGLEVDIERHRITLDGQVLNLSPTEFNLLAHLAREAPRVVPAQELVEKVLGYSLEPWEARELIRFHIHRLRAKVRDASGCTDLIRTVRGVGYTLQE
ncbi:MAG: response regulator transcription factor [Chloroflexia bacterium]